MSYFKYFPTTTYNNYPVADITRRVILSDIVKNSALDYMSYTVQEGERPEDVAYYYYDDPGLAWLVLMANDIIDPYTEWPKSEENLEKYIIAQYESKSGRNGREVLDWAKNETIGNNIIHYQSKLDPEIKLNRASFINLGNSHIIPLNTAVIGDTYTIDTLGLVSRDNFNLIGGTNDLNYAVGSSFTIVNDPSQIDKANTSRVAGEVTSNPAAEFLAVRAYDYEFRLNESRREIFLINKGYLSQIQEQIGEILNND